MSGGKESRGRGESTGTRRDGGPADGFDDPDDVEEVLSVVADPGCREILSRTWRPMTAREVADAVDLPVSTAYRKLDRLSGTPLVVESVRVDPAGRPSAQYERRVEAVSLRLPSEGGRPTVVVRLEGEREPPPPAGHQG